MTKAPAPPPQAIQSMTGSGTAAGETPFGSVLVECRSVNGRGLSVKMRVDGELHGVETTLEAMVRQTLQRGSVHLAIAVTEPPADSSAILDMARARQVAAELEALASDLGKSVELSDILSFPGVVPTASRGSVRVSRELPDALRGLVADALRDLVTSRESEGAGTAAAMLSDLEVLAGELAAITAQAPTVIENYRLRLLQRVNEFLGDRATTMADGDVVREVAVFADRVDIAEELQRLCAHLERGRAMLTGPGPIGRNLEFLVQELLREVNTLGSKSPDAEIVHRVVVMKSCIDKLKEQAANLA